MEEQKTNNSISYEALIAENAELRHELDYLYQRINYLNKQLFGRSSEKSSVVLPEQGSMFELTPLVESKEELRQEDEFTEEHQSRPSQESKAPLKRGRKPLPENLPREQVVYTPDKTNCDLCGKELTKIGEEVTEELEYVPARLVVVEHIRPKLACPCCKSGVEIAKLPANVQPIEKGRPGAGLIAHIAVSKFGDHLPLTRQEAIFARSGLKISKQRMCDWLGEIANQLEPIYKELLKLLLGFSYLQADETIIDVKDDKLPGKLHRGYLWAIHSPPNLVFYHYNESRAGKVPLELFNGYSGTIQADGYHGYDEVFLPDNVTRLGCWAHARRKLLEGGAANSAAGNRLIALIAELYGIEKQSKKLEPSQHLSFRQKKATPVVDKIFTLMTETFNASIPNSALKKAIKYCLNQENELRGYLRDSAYHIDNNSVERMMKGIAVGRNNWLFAGSHNGARTAAILYTLINTCKLNSVNPFDYLKDVIKRLPTHKASQIHELLPQNWRPN